MPRTYLVIPTATQLLELLAGAHHATHQLPPSGMTVGIDATADWLHASDDFFALHLPLYVEGIVPPGTEDHWYWATVGEVLDQVLIGESDAKTWLLQKVAALASRTLGDVLALPLLKKGTANTTMRWISTTIRGTLGGTIEQFQFKVDLGNPGADPDISEAAAAALAEQLAGIWNTVWGITPSNWPSSVKFTELGVVTKTQTDPTNAQGEGGNLEQSYGTQWFMYPSGTVVSGSSGQLALPFEVATAVTLQTDHRGPSGKGRLYLPPTHILSMAAGGVYTTGYVDACNTLISNYFNSIVDETPYVPVVVSRRRIILNEIVSIATGKVPDSQRRRRRSQDEARVEVALGA